jgi:hypothetical protein
MRKSAEKNSEKTSHATDPLILIFYLQVWCHGISLSCCPLVAPCSGWHCCTKLFQVTSPAWKKDIKKTIILLGSPRYIEAFDSEKIVQWYQNKIVFFMEELIKNWFIYPQLKGTVPRDFRLQVFFMNLFENSAHHRCCWRRWQMENLQKSHWYWWCTLTCSANFWKKFEMTLMLFSGAWREDWVVTKNLKQKISWLWPFKPDRMEVGVEYIV